MIGWRTNLVSVVREEENVSKRSQDVSPLALVTGASRGFGRAIAQALLQSGYRVIITARGLTELEATCIELSRFGYVDAIAGDVAERTHRETIANRVHQHGLLSVLINNAAILGPTPRPTLLDLAPKALVDLFAINAIAPLALLQTLQPHLRPDACIINVSSDASPVSYPEWGGYGASKAALDHLTATLAIENPGWSVYAVDPGEMRTQMFEASAPGLDLSYLDDPALSVPGLLDLLTLRPPSGRYLAKPGFGRSASAPRVEPTLQPVGVVCRDPSDASLVTVELDPARFDDRDLQGLEPGQQIELLYRLDPTPLTVTTETRGCFANPDAVRPNPVGVTFGQVVSLGDNRVVLGACDAPHGVAVYDLRPIKHQRVTVTLQKD